MIRPLIFAAACACSLASWGSDDDVRFKPKTYAPRQTLRDSRYRESVYTPSSASQSTEKHVGNASTPGRWSLFNKEKTLDSPKKLANAPAEHEAAYKQEKLISVPTLKADPRDIPEKKPFDENGQKLTDADYKDKTKDGPRKKDPMLTPRQGIKAPE